MKLNSQALSRAKVTEEDFKKWCRENKKPTYLRSSKAEFFSRLADGRLIKDENGNLIKTRKKRITSR